MSCCLDFELVLNAKFTFHQLVGGTFCSQWSAVKGHLAGHLITKSSRHDL